MATDKVFAALASTPRRQILAYLSAQQLTAGDIACLVVGERKGQYCCTGSTLTAC